MIILLWRGGPAMRVAVLSTLLVATATAAYVGSGKYARTVSALRSKPHFGTTAVAPRTLAAPVPPDYLRYDVDGHSLYAPSPWQRGRNDEADLILNLMDPEGGLLLLGRDPDHDGRTLERAMDDQPSHLAPLFTDFKVVDAEIVLLDGRPAGVLQYSGTSEHDKATRVVQFVRVKDGREYTLTFFALTGHYAALRPMADEVAVSWRLPGEAQDVVVTPVP